MPYMKDNAYRTSSAEMRGTYLKLLKDLSDQ